MDREEREEAPAGQPYLRLSAAQKDRFLEVLGQTGNRRAAAEAIGVEPRLMDQRRKYDKVLDRQWAAALAQADRRLSGAAGPFDCIGARQLNVIRRGRGGRIQLVAAGAKRWCKAIEDRFLATLGMCGNIAASARAVGFSESCVWQRRRAWPDFARRMEEVLEEAELRIEFRLASIGSEAETGAGAGDGMGTFGSNPPAPFDPDFALRFLKWREEKRTGRGSKGRRHMRPEPSVEEVRAKILAKLDAIERHEARKAAKAAEEARQGQSPGTATGDCPE